MYFATTAQSYKRRQCLILLKKLIMSLFLRDSIISLSVDSSAKLLRSTVIILERRHVLKKLIMSLFLRDSIISLPVDNSAKLLRRTVVILEHRCVLILFTEENIRSTLQDV